MGGRKPIQVNPGHRYERLTVIAEIKSDNRSKPGYGRMERRYIKCLCDCGNETVVKLKQLHYKETRSCGCLMREHAKQNIVKATQSRLKFNASGVKAKGTHEYESYRNMKTRCYNPKHRGYRWYGAKGIKVCDRWLEPHGFGFKNFLEDMGPKPTPKHQVDRIDSDKDYGPGNCKWATHLEQQHNKKKAIIIGETYNGVKVLERIPSSYKVICFCGNERIIHPTTLSKIKLNKLKSCRCK